MVNPISIEVLNHIRINGVLSERRLQAYEGVVQFPNYTQAEICKRIGMTRHCMAGRCKELSEMDLIYQTGQRICTETQHLAGTYQSTWRMLKNYQKKKSNKQIIKDLQAEVEYLKKRLSIYELL